jgi:cysteine-rich repeat protein
VPGRACTPICGDGLVIGGEACDDGNSAGGDGCSRVCQLERRSFDGGDAFFPVCGDGIVTPDEECDCGGGTVPLPRGCVQPNSDSSYGGCTTQCAYGPYCGDGLVSGPEECDTGRVGVVHYGQKGDCTFECTRASYCGDGKLDLDEECDLGDLNGIWLNFVDGGLSPSDSGYVICERDCRIPYYDSVGRRTSPPYPAR